MPYNPKAISQDDRTFGYNAMWIGLPCSILLLASMQFEAMSFLTAGVGGFVCGTLIGLVFTWKQDEVFRSEVAFAANFALCFAGIALFVQIIPFGRDWEYDPGVMLAIMALIFHVAIAYRRIRDR
jgi:peptidoglycan/LPS O-acetylase OafA/YrhL